MTDNLHRKASCCRADLEFLLSIVPAGWIEEKGYIIVCLAALKNPTEEIITKAWKSAAYVHEKIRKHGLSNNDIREN